MSKPVLIHADVVEDTAREQITTICDSPALQGLIAIMPDVHAGAGCVIGFTGKFDRAVIPNIVGVDIGCGVSCYELGNLEIQYDNLDKNIRKYVPLGFNSHKGSRWLDATGELPKKIYEICIKANEFYEYPLTKMSTEPILQLGTLGGGNHFIEIDTDQDNNKYLIVHSGSRSFGLKVATYFQRQAKQLCNSMLLDIPTGLEYLPMKMGGGEYMKWLYVAQQYAQINRQVMTEAILHTMNIEFNKDKYFESVHNFISPKDHIIRKGAISAHKGERVIIPLNMAEGCVLGTGKGVSKYNYSAPHGAGRVFGRKELHRLLKNPDNKEITMENFKASMTGIYSTSIQPETIDESPFAYKKYDDIARHLTETIEVERILKPVYNLKANEVRQ